MSLLLAMLLAQAGTTIIVDPAVQSKRAKVTTTAGGALQVECVGGTCSGSGGPGAAQTWVTLDGGVASVYLLDAGVLNVQGPLTDTQLRASAVPVTANAGSNLNTSALALSATQTDRTQKAQVTDGTRDGTVKAASTAAAAGDTSLVVALSPNSPLPAGTAVLGHVIHDTGSTTAVTGNVTVVQGTGTNLHAVLDTTSTTAVTQATGTNLHAVLDATSTTAVTQATASSLNAQVVGAGASGAAKSGNPVQVGGVFNTTQPTVTTGQGVEAQATARGALIVASGVDAIAVNNTQQGTAAQNVTQFGGTNVSTGTGAGGAGIPRVTLSSDSSLAANQSVNVAQINGVAPLMGVGASGTGAQRVAALIHDGTTTAGVIAATTALKTDLSSVAGTATSTAAAGVAKVGVVGNAGAAIDAVNNAAAPANVIVDGFEAQSSALGTSATASNVRRGIVGLDGVLYVREGGPLLFTGGVTAIGATLTQVVAAPAAGTSLYLTDVMAMSDTATAGTFIVRYGTSSNCGTGTTSIYPSSVTAAKSMYPGNAAAPLVLNFHTPLKIPAANALCILCVATNTCTAQFWGYTAP